MGFFQIRTSLVAAAVAILLPVAAQAQDVCRNYVQQSSNAGDCDSCSVRLRPNGQGYIIKSSNGWAARAQWSNGDPTEAEGAGVWDDNLGTAYAGQPFDISLTASGGDLDVTMTMQDHRKFRNPIDVRYHCAD